MNVKLTTPTNMFFALALIILVWLSYMFSVGIFANGVERGRAICEFETVIRSDIQNKKSQTAISAAVFLLSRSNVVYGPHSVTVCVDKGTSIARLSEPCRLENEYSVVFPIKRDDATGAVTHIGTPTVQ